MNQSSLRMQGKLNTARLTAVKMNITVMRIMWIEVHANGGLYKITKIGTHWNCCSAFVTNKRRSA